MDVSQLVNILKRQMREGDQTNQEEEKQADFQARNHFKAPTPTKSSQTNHKKDDEERPDSKMNPKQLKDKQSKNPKYDSESEFDEDDNPLDMFHSQITKNVINADEETDEETDNTTAVNKNANIREKPFNLSNCNNYEKFVKIVNSFRASESIRNDKIVKQYWEKLTLAEKQAIYIFFDNLTRTSDAEKHPDFKMPKTPTQLGVKISPAGEMPNKNKTAQIPNKPVTNTSTTNNNSNKPIIPITVGESHKRYISIDALLKEVK